ncbi:hypothetical protein LCI18_006829 [Fusarium solani-melongenae]|uniref:Uncharacterized protein n=1 Tax=Fusarium solani subsp. cucurbitae TaxID=2747967 RepID=A0ACD3Z3T2_FUSSC|nr:hypothetical protein LCI18_006829 [Fusarium solani-melongenae]
MSQQQTRLVAQVQDTQPEREYEYQPLPSGRFARYLTLEPASSDTDPLVCNLYAAKLNEFPPFEAISYVWGVPVKDRLISCNGQATRITANLFDALRQVRFGNKPRTLWADSICINQADTQECGHQVSLMGQIYKQSSCTLICLGASAHAHAPIVAELVADVDSMIQRVFGRADFSWAPNSFPLADEDEPLLSHRGWESFGILLQQPWFRRGWVVQEAALGQSTVVLWADTTINWLKIVRAYIWCTRRALRLPEIQELWMSDVHLDGFHTRRNREAVTFRPSGAVEPLTLVQILDCARWLGVSDPRDRIYAFLGLLNADELLPIFQPSYEVPCIQVYRDFACEYLRRSQDLDILHFVHNDESTLEGALASWVPRWDMSLYSSYTGSINNYSPLSRRIMPQTSSSRITVSQDQATLGLRTMLIDTVAFTGPKFDKNSTTAEDVASLWESVSTMSGPLPYSCSPLLAFVTIFRCGVYRGRLNEWKVLQSAYMQLLQRELSHGDASYGSAEKFHTLRMEDVHNKRFIKTHRGYYGLAPKAVQEGDVCCIIFGTRSLFILRKTDQSGRYKLVGSVLILGKELDHNGYPMVLGDEDCEDWAEWGLDEEDIFLC